MERRELTQVNRTIAICLCFLAALAAIVALSAAKVFLAPTLVALLIALTLSPIAQVLERKGLRPEAASALVIASALGALGALGYMLAPSYEVWRTRFPEIAASLKQRFREVGEKLEEVKETAKVVQEVAENATGAATGAANAPDAAPAPALVAPGQIVLDWLADAPAIAATLLYVTLLAFFVMAERDTLYRGLVGMMPNVRRRRHLVRVLRDMRRGVSQYLLTITMINIALGVVATAAFYLIGLPNAPLWGAAAALLNYVPFLGPATLAVLVFTVGLVSYDEVMMAFAPVGVVVAINLVEGQILTPMVVGRSAAVSSLAVFFAVSFGAWLWGPVGALLATPTLIVGRIWFERFDILPRMQPPRAPERRRSPLISASATR